ncbi:MAG: SGNH/GDSL hydrolase family protein [Planctomycetes bacterium]|nr:SGNH/GDSL hydrolase family protein [Planctomycetota bacterium]
MSGWRGVIVCAGLGVVLFAIGWSVRAWRDGGAFDTWNRETVRELVPDAGFAFRAALPAGVPSDDEPGTRTALLEDGRPFGVVADHVAIRQLGGGRYSFWRGTLYFSTEDGSDPRSNGRRYEAAWPSAGKRALERGTRYGAWTLIVLASILGLRRAFRPSRRTMAKLALVPASALVALGGTELWLRIRYPFADNVWPGRFDPTVGFVFQPGAVVRQTNLFDYCIEQRTNGLGFLDREVGAEVPPGTRRIVVLGDSFVEAVQVPIEAKFHVVLERLMLARGERVATHAFGMSGSGTSNELAFYEAFASRLAPAAALVIVLVVNNDVPNNSALLEAVRNGWHPAHPPRLFFGVEGEAITRIPIDPNWAEHRLPVQEPVAPRSSLDGIRLVRWARANLAAATGADFQPVFDVYARRLEWLRRTPAWRDALAGWNWPDDVDFDVMTACADPPPAFTEALRLTEHSLAVLRDRVRESGGSVLVVGCHNLGIPVSANTYGRTHFPRYWIDVIEPMCARLELPFLDLHADFAGKGILGSVQFARDGHWNAFGHASAAAAIDEFLAAHKELLTPR